MICEIPTLPRQTLSWMGFWNRKPIKFWPYITKTACFNSLYDTIPSPGDKHIHMWYTQPMRWRCVAHHFRVKRSKAKVTRVVRIFCRVRSVAPSLFDQFTSYVKHTHTQPMKWRCVAHDFRVKGQGHTGRSKFFPCLLRGSVPIWPINDGWNTHITHEVTTWRASFLGQKVKDQGQLGRSKFLLCPLRGSVPIWHIHFICGTYTANEVMMYHASFPDQKVKGQDYTGHSKYLPCPLRDFKVWLLGPLPVSVMRCW